MENYKIKVNNEAESKEVQELFFELGYGWHGKGKSVSYLDKIPSDKFGWLVLWKPPYLKNTVIQMGSGFEGFEELTIPQLRDMVFAHRKPTEQGLISGADALRALADGKEVEYWCENDPSIQKRWTPIKALNEYRLSYFLENKPRFEFRLKPCTIKLSLEIPAPLSDAEQMKGQVYYLNDCFPDGYGLMELDPNDTPFTIGAWRTEEEIKQVVAALRGGIKG